MSPTIRSSDPYICMDESPSIPERLKATGSVYALGTFDGMHLGHQAVLGQALHIAQQAGQHAGLFSFSTHPKKRLEGEGAVSLLVSPEERQQLSAMMGLDVLVMPPFTEAFRTLSHEAFIRDVMVKNLGAKHLVVGYDFRFGHQRLGSAAWLQEHAEALDIGVTVVAPVHPASPSNCNEPISSTIIRQHLKQGDVETAQHLLGRAYHLSGTSVSGKQLGRQLGFPTLNVAVDRSDRLMPGNGVYVGATWTDGRWFPSVMNIGVAPTVKENTPLQHPCLESHVLIDFPYENWVNQPLHVAFFTRLRDEQAFPNLEALKAQLSMDVENAHAWIAAHPAFMSQLSRIPTP